MEEAVIRPAAVFAALFGALTVFSGARVLFGDGAAAAGSYVPYIVWFNFLAGFAYVAAAIGLWRRRPWAAGMALALALLTALFFAALGGHIAAGAAYEMRTVIAMAVRTGFWLAIAALACASLARRCPSVGPG
jgi:hypothetical protein